MRSKQSMDWSKQIQDTFKIYSDAQSKMVEGVTKVIHELTTPPTTTTWGDTIDRWERVSRDVRKMQADWTDLWIRGIAVTTNNSQEMAEWTKQVRQLSDIMNEYQDQYWHTWLTVLKQLDPTK